MTDCFCIKEPGYDFLIQVVDKETLVYMDMSRWMDEGQYIIPDEHEVTVLFPDSSIHTVMVKPRASTVLKAEDLGISRFKDGIYCFSLDPDSEVSGGCGISQTKVAGVFPKIECCLYAAYSKLDDSRYEELQEIELWIRSAKASSELGLEKQAISEYTVAKRKLDKLNCDCDC